MVNERTIVFAMKYVRTHETRDKFLADKDSTSRGFRLAPTLYKYSDESEDEDNRDHIYLELDDPRKHGDSTYMEIALNSDVEFSFYIGNKSGDTQTTMTCSIDWGDGTVETKTITTDDKGFKLSHNYKAGSYKIELYDVERDYSVEGDTNSSSRNSLISPIDSVKRVVLGDGVVSITRTAFSECTSLRSIYIPKGVTSINYRTFRNCPSLVYANIPRGVTIIKNQAFSLCYSLRSINIPEGVAIIAGEAFYGCSSLKSIYIPKSVTTIGYRVFRNCSSLSSVYIPESVTSIGTYAFQYCTSLTSIYIPEGVTSIETYAFQYCSSLKSIDIPEKVTSIGDSAFYGCKSLKSISSFNPTTPTIGSNIFIGLPTNGTLHIKPGATGYDAWLSKLPEGWKIVESL